MNMKDEALRLALEALKHTESRFHTIAWGREQDAITAIKAALANEALERKAENARELGLDYEPYGFEASMYSNDRMKVDPVTGNVSIGTVKKPCGLECDCTDVCKQDDYKALWQQMCERCDELDKKLAHQEAKNEPVGLIESLKDAQPCCGQYETCWRACTPRGEFLGQRDAQRTWVGLTDEEIAEVEDEYIVDYRIPAGSAWNFAKDIEAKLKEKNT
jgi:hypothetical protein